MSIISKLKYSVIFVHLLSLTACATLKASPSEKTISMTLEPKNNQALVYIFRNWSIYGGGVATQVFADTTHIGDLDTNYYLYFFTNASQLQISYFYSSYRQNISLEKGKKYYYAFDTTSYLKQLSESEARDLMSKYSLTGAHYTKMFQPKAIATMDNDSNRHSETIFDASLSDKTSDPTITIISPQLKRGLKISAREQSLTVTGIVHDTSGVAGVTVNGHPASLDERGNFASELLLKIGENNVVVEAVNVHRKRITERFTVVRAADQVVKARQSEAATVSGIGFGKYYALLIAVEDYANPEINRLDYPVVDAQKVNDALTRDYTFEQQNVILLKNPDRKTIFKAFQDLKSRITPKDNLLVFYAGHGVWQDDMQQGYWLPRDAADPNDPSDWIPNTTVRDYIKAIKAKHVLLVADACFSGGIFKVRDAFNRPTASVEKIYEMPSRKAITSGSLKTVPDKSVFVKYLVQRLNENQDRYLDAQKLFVSFKEAVINNSAVSQTPLYGAIAEAGDEGGDFIFVRR